MHGPDYILDLSNLPDRGSTPGAAKDDSRPAPGLQGRPWLAIYWKCCNEYGRVYRNVSGDAYEGHCPHCGRSVTARVDPGGTTSRFFTAE